MVANERVNVAAYDNSFPEKTIFKTVVSVHTRCFF